MSLSISANLNFNRLSNFVLDGFHFVLNKIYDIYDGVVNLQSYRIERLTSAVRKIKIDQLNAKLLESDKERDRLNSIINDLKFNFKIEQGINRHALRLMGEMELEKN